MHRGFFATVALTLATGLLFGQSGSTVAQSRHRPERVAEAVTAPPLIVAPDAKTPITLREARVDVETSGSLARTTLLLTLFNPNDRPLEGTLEFPLRAGQQVTGFALDIDGQLRDAVPVPKQKAQQVFESIERRNVDPGLLEQTAGNHFRLRVYPIPARGTRQARLVIDEAMHRDGNAWRLETPVHLLAGTDHFALRVRAQGLRRAPEVVGHFDGLKFERSGRAHVATVERDGFRPDTGLALRFPAQDTPQTYVQAVGDERYVLAEMMLPSFPGGIPPRVPPSSVGVLWDASASARRHDHDLQFSLLDRYFSLMGNGTVTLRYLRDVGMDAGRFEIRNGDWSALRRTLEATVYDGASDLADWAPDPAVGEYLLFSDGLRNYGEAAFPQLKSGQRLFAIAPKGGQSDLALLAALTEARGGEAGEGRLAGTHARVDALRGEGVTDLQVETRNVGEGVVLRVAGRLTATSGRIRVVITRGSGSETFDMPVAADAPQSPLVAGLWAHWTVASFAAEPEHYRAEIARIGQRFGIVTPGTSLLVLESPEDYVRYDIPAPPALREQVDALLRTRERERTDTRQQRLDDVAARFEERVTWWGRKFPKDAPPKRKEEDSRGGGGDDLDEVAVTGSRIVAADAAPAPVMSAPMPPPPPPAEAPGLRPTREEAERAQPVHIVTREEIEAETKRSGFRAVPDLMNFSSLRSPGEGATIRLQAWEPDSEYARRLRDARAEDVYALYLDERDSHADSTAFYLDVADLLLKKGRRAEGLRVLSNLAELKLENRHILRVLDYRLMQAEDWAHAVAVLREVLRLADEEPQSHRDLGLALAGAGQRQEAIRHLYDVAARTWDDRFSEVELVALNEMNEVIATSQEALDLSFIDRRLLKNMPLDLRVVLSWDSDNSDMDLWVTDPNGEKCYYGNRNTRQGGLLSDDFTGGYGPEEFVLRDAKPGRYKVEANFFGDRQQIVTGATTLNLRLTTGWGTYQRRHQTVTLRLSGKSETVVVGEFDVK